MSRSAPVRQKGHLPKAYLRIDPNLDQTHPNPGDFLRLLCAANRQPKRGRFKDRRLLDHLLGRGRAQRLIDRGDVVGVPEGGYLVPGWDDWQEGDVSVGERMARYREKHALSGAERTAAWRLRNYVFERDHFACRYCGASDYPRNLLVTDHVIPATRGGEATADNLVTACRPCNFKKGAHTPEEAGMPLLPCYEASETGEPGRFVTGHSDASQRNAPSEALGVRRQASGVTEDNQIPMGAAAAVPTTGNGEQPAAGGGGSTTMADVHADDAATAGGVVEGAHPGGASNLPVSAHPAPVPCLGVSPYGMDARSPGHSPWGEALLDHDPDNPLERRLAWRVADLASRDTAPDPPSAEAALRVLAAVSHTLRDGRELVAIRGAPERWLITTLQACDDFERDLADESVPAGSGEEA